MNMSHNIDDTRTLHVERSTSTAHRLLNYDGACRNVHGHNMDWDVTISLDMVDEDDPTNMPLDFKEVSDTIDEVDHAILLNETDPLYNEVANALGDFITFEGDPTCEVMAKWMAEKLFDLDEAVNHVTVSVAETDKYSIETSYGEYDRLRELGEE